MPYPMDPNDYRNQIADAMTSRADRSPLAQGMAALPNMGAMPVTAPAGMPATPAGGVPGSGMAPAGPSVMPAPPPQMGGGAMPPIGGLGMSAPPPPMTGGRGAMPTPYGGGVDASGMMPGTGMRGMRRPRGY